MDYSKLIHDYLDSELDTVNQDLLFSELAQNQDLRIDFNRQVKIQIAAQNDMSVLTPPAQTTNAIFASLGFSIPPKTYLQNLYKPAGAAATVAGTIFSFVTKNLAILSTIAVTALVTTSVVFVSQNYLAHNTKSLNNSKNTTISEKVITGVASIPITSSIETFADNTNFNNNNASKTGSNGNENANQNGNFSKNTKGGYYDYNIIRNYQGSTTRNRTASTNQQNKTTLASNANESSTANSLLNNKIRPTSGENYYQQNTPFSQGNSQGIGSIGNSTIPGSVDFLPYFSDISVDNSTWSLSCRKLYSRSFNQVNNLMPQTKLNDYSFTLLYKLDKYQNVGIELGWENFMQIFQYMKDGKMNDYYQNPSLFWGGLAYRINFLDYGISDLLYPYVQGVIGATGVGPLAKGQLGLQFKPLNAIRLTACAELTGLGYSVSKTYYFTGKYGFSVGGSINF